MFDRSLKKKRRALDAANAVLERAYKAGEEEGLTGEDLEGKVHEWSTEVRLAQEEYKAERDKKLVIEAFRLEIPIPTRAPPHENWESGIRGYPQYLTDSAHADLRTAVRAERIARNDVWMRWAIVVIALGASPSIV